MPTCPKCETELEWVVDDVGAYYKCNGCFDVFPSGKPMNPRQETPADGS